MGVTLLFSLRHNERPDETYNALNSSRLKQMAPEVGFETIDPDESLRDSGIPLQESIRDPLG
jgi:hypothetical protein